jgi:hypothetical protein
LFLPAALHLDPAGTPLASREAWRVASPTPRLNTKAGFINTMSYRLPKYYFQDIHPDVMDEIMRGMQAALPEPSWEEIDHWLNTPQHRVDHSGLVRSRRRIHLGW